MKVPSPSRILWSHHRGQMARSQLWSVHLVGPCVSVLLISPRTPPPASRLPPGTICPPSTNSRMVALEVNCPHVTSAWCSQLYQDQSRVLPRWGPRMRGSQEARRVSLGMSCAGRRSRRRERASWPRPVFKRLSVPTLLFPGTVCCMCSLGQAKGAVCSNMACLD